jgi:hypothetical protein
MSPHLIIIFLLFVIVGILVSEQYNFEYFRFEHIHFMSKKELQDFFRNDPDGYFKSFNEINLKAYGYKTIQAYVDAAIKDADDFSEKEKEYLTKEMKRADEFLKTFDKIPYFPAKKVADIPWKLAKTKHNVYEKGYPHTRLDIIFMPGDILMDRDIIRTLVHEKVHVFSRLYPDDMQKWNDHNGFKKFNLLKNYPLARNNPDVDGIVYMDKNGKETLAQYRTKYPLSIEEAYYPYGQDYTKEHPNEVLAYKVDAYIR